MPTPRDLEGRTLEENLKERTLEQIVDLLLNDLRELPSDLRNLNTTLQDLTRRFEEHQAVCGTRFQGINEDITNRLLAAQASLEMAARLAAEQAAQMAASAAAQVAARDAVKTQLSAAEAEVKAVGANLEKTWGPAALDKKIEEKTIPIGRIAAAALFIGAFLLSMHYENISLGKLLGAVWLFVRAYIGL